MIYVLQSSQNLISCRAMIRSAVQLHKSEPRLDTAVCYTHKHLPVSWILRLIWKPPGFHMKRNTANALGMCENEADYVTARQVLQRQETWDTEQHFESYCTSCRISIFDKLLETSHLLLYVVDVRRLAASRFFFIFQCIFFLSYKSHDRMSLKEQPYL